ncbi:hypothetical protein RV11_GL002750 [Enterococcus phoeniculicola]|nr:hypothetical protein RV11_GL002750 [Enterococcus phoeniculicola]
MCFYKNIFKWKKNGDVKKNGASNELYYEMRKEQVNKNE